MASASRLGSCLRLLSQQSVGPSAVRPLTTSAISSAAAKKPAAAKRKAVVKKKPTHTGPRSAGSRRKGTSSSTSSLSSTSEFHIPPADMSHLPLLHAESLTPASTNQVFAFNDRTLAAFKAFGLPQELEKEFANQPKPRALVRKQTLEVLDALDKSKEGNKGTRLMLDGARGSGKSVLMAQAVAYALDDGWVVISVPRAVNLINSSTEFTYSAQHKAYVQPEATKTLLEAVLKVNGASLKQIKTSESVTMDGGKLEEGTTLEALIKRAVEDTTSPTSRQTLLEAVFKTLANQTEKPVLVAVDDAQSLFRTTLYRDPDFIRLESFELGLPRSLLSLLTAPSYALQRGAFLSAFSTTHTEFPTPPELSIALAEKKGEKIMTQAINAYTQTNPQHLDHATAALKGAEVVDTSKPLSKEEAGELFKQLKEERRCWSAVNDELFLEKLVESSGNARVFSRSLVSTLL